MEKITRSKQNSNQTILSHPLPEYSPIEYSKYAAKHQPGIGKIRGTEEYPAETDKVEGNNYSHCFHETGIHKLEVQN